MRGAGELAMADIPGLIHIATTGESEAAATAIYDRRCHAAYHRTR